MSVSTLLCLSHGTHFLTTSADDDDDDELVMMMMLLVVTSQTSAGMQTLYTVDANIVLSAGHAFLLSCSSFLAPYCC